MIRRIQHFLYTLLLYLLPVAITTHANGQLRHNKERVLHYQPSGTDFLLHEGTKKFNRALYGSNTGFRVETGDLPEFAMYMPGMGGNCKIGIVVNNKSKWLTEADDIQTIYRPGSMLYEIKDKLLQNGSVHLHVLAMAEADGMIIKIDSRNVPSNLTFVIAYGGATGKKFSRDGDIGADPESSFYLQPDYCKDNQYSIEQNTFRLYYGFTKALTDDERYEIQYGKAPDTTKKDKPKLISGIFPKGSLLKTGDAQEQASPVRLQKSKPSEGTPVLVATYNNAGNKTLYVAMNKDSLIADDAMLPDLFAKAEAARNKVAKRIILETPDKYINPLGSALAIAADAIWETPSFLHGSIAWRMRLPAWRGAYAADALGWHDRARLHFDSYLKSQVKDMPPGAVEPDTALHFARQKERMGNAMFSNGYICRNPNGDIRPHHYDMNLVFIDQLLTHFNYTGDIAYLKKVWPSIKLHLEWEKRNFDVDGDGLYDAYACIWASDALQYSGGGVTHSSAYNYRANKSAARIATLLKEDAGVYEREAVKILAAANQKLWIKEKGLFAEYIDLHGLQLAHSSPGLWTIYHAIDEGLATPEQQFQMLRYVDREIPHIPVKARDFPFNDLQLLSTTNWQPYTWSINNVALAENLHTALAYWQSGENNNAFHLWKSSVAESMYLSSSPGGFQQLSFYDAVRGELYRDFADPVGMAARTLTEGLFGIQPDALNNTLHISPGFPDDWKFAKLSLPDITFDFKESGNTSVFKITQHYPQQMALALRVKALKDQVATVYVNGVKATYNWIKNAMHHPVIEVNAGKQTTYDIQITWDGNAIDRAARPPAIAKGESFQLSYSKATILSVNDPQNAFSIDEKLSKQANISANKEGAHSLFLQLKQGDALWTAPLSIEVKPIIEIRSSETEQHDQRKIEITNNSASNKKGVLSINGHKEPVAVKAHASLAVNLTSASLVKGTNKIHIHWEDGTDSYQHVAYWDMKAAGQYEAINISTVLNDNVTKSFTHKYLSPRAASTTLQMPWQGIGNWCYPLIQPEISGDGIKKDSLLFDRIPFSLGDKNNIAYTSQWNNFPDSIYVPLTGRSSHAYLLMAGTTNHQQSQMTNGMVYIEYIDGSTDSLPLINPENWWPLEQDYMDDGFAFKSGPRPYRLIFKTGDFTRDYNTYSSIKGFTNSAIEGGAGTVLDLPLNPDKELKSLKLKAITNEVLIGLMSVTLQRH